MRLTIASFGSYWLTSKVNLKTPPSLENALILSCPIRRQRLGLLQYLLQANYHNLREQHGVRWSAVELKFLPLWERSTRAASQVRGFALSRQTVTPHPIPRLRRRAALLNRSLFCAILSAILTALIIIVAFISAYFQIAHEYGAALLFTGALVMFCAALIDLARETRLALHDNDLRT